MNPGKRALFKEEKLSKASNQEFHLRILEGFQNAETYQSADF